MDLLATHLRVVFVETRFENLLFHFFQCSCSYLTVRLRRVVVRATPADMAVTVIW